MIPGLFAFCCALLAFPIPGLAGEAPAGNADVIAEIDRLRRSLKDKHPLLAGFMEGLRQNPRAGHTYRMVAEMAYQVGQRKLALELLDLGVRVAKDRGGLVAARRKLYRYELDIKKLEKSYRDEIGAAAAGRGGISHDLIWDSVMLARLLPRCEQLYRAKPANDALFEFLRAAYKDGKKSDKLVALYSLRLNAVPADEQTPGNLLHFLIEAKKYGTLADEAGKLPTAARKNRYFPLYRMQALLALRRKKEALALGAAIENGLPNWKWHWKWLAELYVEAGQKGKALAVTRRYAPSGSHESAMAFAKCGDARATLACVKQVLDRKAPAWVIFQCVDACRLAGEKKRAEEVFAIAEAQCIKEARKSTRGIPGQITWRYNHEDREERYLEMCIKIWGTKKAPYESTLKALVKKKGAKYGLRFLEKHLPANANRREFLLLYAGALEDAKQFRKAMKVYRKAERLPRKHTYVFLPDPFFGQLRCYEGLKQMDACEAWLKSRMRKAPDLIPRCLADLYEKQGKTRKAVNTYRRAKRHMEAVQYLLGKGMVHDALAYARALPKGTERSRLERAIKRHQKDIPGLIEILKEEVRRSPRAGDKHAKLALYLFKVGQAGEGRKHFRQALRLGGVYHILWPFSILPSCDVGFSRGVAYEGVVDVYLRAGLRAELEADFKPLLSRTNAHRAAHLEAVAGWYFANKQKAKAAPVYERLRKLNPYVAELCTRRIAAAAGRADR